MSEEWKEKVVEEGALPPLIALAGGRSPQVQRQAARALFVLTAKEGIKDLIVSGGGLVPLVALASSSSEETQVTN